jgi:hypothetical protein
VRDDESLCHFDGLLLRSVSGDELMLTDSGRESESVSARVQTKVPGSMSRLLKDGWREPRLLAADSSIEPRPTRQEGFKHSLTQT